MRKTCELGGLGVDIKLTGFHDHGNRVFWSKRKNSYVIAEAGDESNYELFLTVDGTRVRLYNINGVGEIRWLVSTHAYEPDDLAAIEWFGLKKVEE